MVDIEPNQNKINAFKDEDLVCYCFGYTKRDIENDWKHYGRSMIYRRIASKKKSGECHCAALNPKGL